MLIQKVAFFFWANEKFGGAERRYARLAAHLQSTDVCDVTVFGKEPFFRALEDMGVTLNECEIIAYPSQDGVSKVRSIALFIKSLWDVRARGFDQVHMCLNPALLTFLYAMFSSYLPRFSMSMNAGLFSASESFLTKRIFAPFAVEKAVAVDCLGPRYKRVISQYVLPKSYSKLHVAPCSFVDIRAAYTAASRDIDICFLARFVRGKGIELMEEALAGVSDLSVHVCGHGPITPKIPIAKVYHSTNPSSVLSRAKIFLSLQREDNYPSQSLMEAMLHGCAVIATDVGDTRLLLNEDNSILIPYEPLALRDAIKKLLGDQQLRQELASRAQKTIQKNQTIERYAEYFAPTIIAK